MPPSAGPGPVAGSPTEEHDASRADAAASFFRDDGERLLAVSATLRSSRPTLEARVRGGSMGMVLPHGAPVRVRLGADGPYRAGDIVVFLARGALYVHRIVHCGRRRGARGYLITQGDAIAVPDPPVATSSVLGEVTAVLREGQWARPAAAPARPVLPRWTAHLLCTIVAATAEVSVPLAERLATTIGALRTAVVRRPPARRAVRFLIRRLAARGRSRSDAA